MIGWRYAIFTLDGSAVGYDDYDGMVIDLSQPFSASTCGFYQALLYYDGGPYEITSSHQLYWYISEASKGVSIITTKNNYSSGEMVQVAIGAGDESKAQMYLNRVQFQLIDKNGAVTWNGSSALSGVQSTLDVCEITAGGSYTLRVKMYSLENTSSYIKDIAFTVAGTGTQGGAGGVNDITKGFMSWLDGFLGMFGLDNTAGHIVAIILFMLVAFILCNGDKLMRWVAPCVVFILGVVSTWIPIWITIVLFIFVGAIVARTAVSTAKGGA